MTLSKVSVKDSKKYLDRLIHYDVFNGQRLRRLTTLSVPWADVFITCGIRIKNNWENLQGENEFKTLSEMF